MNIAAALPRITRAAEGMNRRRFTVAEIEAMVRAGVMDEDERVELIGGELVPMSPKGNRHEAMKTKLLRRWNRVAPDDLDITPETTLHLSSDTYLEPDLVIYPSAEGIGGLCAENVLLVVEIADSSRRYDLGRKARLYSGFGIRELWVIDAVKRTLRAHLKPTADGYGETRDFSRGDLATPTFAPDVFALRLNALEIR